jgi:hypothetical protein
LCCFGGRTSKTIDLILWWSEDLRRRFEFAYKAELDEAEVRALRLSRQLELSYMPYYETNMNLKYNLPVCSLYAL